MKINMVSREERVQQQLDWQFSQRWLEPSMWGHLPFQHKSGKKYTVQQADCIKQTSKSELAKPKSDSFQIESKKYLLDKLNLTIEI